MGRAALLVVLGGACKKPTEAPTPAPSPRAAPSATSPSPTETPAPAQVAPVEAEAKGPAAATDSDLAMAVWNEHAVVYLKNTRTVVLPNDQSVDGDGGLVVVFWSLAKAEPSEKDSVEVQEVGSPPSGVAQEEIERRMHGGGGVVLSRQEWDGGAPYQVGSARLVWAAKKRTLSLVPAKGSPKVIHEYDGGEARPSGIYAIPGEPDYVVVELDYMTKDEFGTRKSTQRELVRP
jgi:hypothetical protein